MKNTFKKALALLLSAMLVFGASPIIGLDLGSIGYAASEVWDGTRAEAFADGTGTQADPFIIETAEQLARLADNSVLQNLPAEDEGEPYFKLANDIVLNDTSVQGWENSESANQWVPIGKTREPGFYGTFDGDGHSVSGMIISGGFEALGLFGFIWDAAIKNLTVTDSVVIDNSSPSTGQSFAISVAILVGVATGEYANEIENCTVTDSCTVSGILHVGGIIGYAGCESLSIKDCSSAADVSAQAVVGVCFAGGISGMLGVNTLNVSGCQNSGSISTPSTGNNVYYLGGIAGEIESDSIAGGFVTDCRNSGEITAEIICADDDTDRTGFEACIGGIFGRMSGIEARGCSNSGDVSIRSNVTYEAISSLGGIVGESGGGSVYGCANSGVLSAELGANSNYMGGIIGYGYATQMENCVNSGNISTAFTDSGYVKTGGIAGELYSEIEILLRGCSNSGDITVSVPNLWRANVGGVLGSGECYNMDVEAAIVKCMNSGEVAVTAGGDDNRITFVGGVAGYVGVVYNCYNAGEVSVSGIGADLCVGGVAGECNKVFGCYNAGSVSASSSGTDVYVGGVAGCAYDLSMGCYYLEDTCDIGIGNNPTDVNTAPLTDAQMQLTSSFDEWDFITVWGFDCTDGYCYPQFVTAPAPDGGFDSGDGSEQTPYVIKTAQQLRWLAATVNVGESFEGKFISLEDTIDLSVLTGSNWVPIGNETYPFSGTFLGNGNIVLNVNIYPGIDCPAGLFGVAEGAVIKDVYVAHEYGNYAIATINDGGMIVGRAVNTDIIGCGALSGTATIVQSTPVAIGAIGGIAGTAVNCRIIECRNTIVNVNNDSKYPSAAAGGIVGKAVNTVIERCESTAPVYSESIAGGLVGIASGCVINDCCSYPFNSGSSIRGEYRAAGIAGEAIGGTEINRCYSLWTNITTNGQMTSGSAALACTGFIGRDLYAQDCYFTGTPNVTFAFFNDENRTKVNNGATLLSPADEFLVEENFEGFDFENVWIMPTESYREQGPRLRAHFTPVTSISIPETLTIEVGEEFTEWKIDVEPQIQTAPPANLNYTFASSNTSVLALISTDSPSFRGVSEGTATVTISLSGDPEIRTECLVTVVAAGGHMHNYSTSGKIIYEDCEDICRRYHCSCGAYKETYTDGPGHTEIITMQPATCTQWGGEYTYCSVCNKVLDYGEGVEPLNHDWAATYTVDVPATCVESGCKSIHCSRCTQRKNVTVIEATGVHTPVTDAAVPATCTATGLTAGSHCSVCEEVITAQAETARLNHTPGEWIVDTAAGVRCKKCTVCQTVLETEDFIGTTITITPPSKTTINYGDTLVLRANTSDMPAGAKVVWTAEGDGFDLKPSADGMTCEATSQANGEMIITAKVVDEDGNAIMDGEKQISATQKLTSKAGFFQKLISFFKNLFNINRVIAQAIGKIY